MVQILDYDAQYAAVMKQVFGGTLIVRNVDVGTQLAKVARIDCVTLDGKRWERRGLRDWG